MKNKDLTTWLIWGLSILPDVFCFTLTTSCPSTPPTTAQTGDISEKQQLWANRTGNNVTTEKVRGYFINDRTYKNVAKTGYHLVRHKKAGCVNVKVVVILPQLMPIFILVFLFLHVRFLNFCGENH